MLSRRHLLSATLVALSLACSKEKENVRKLPEPSAEEKELLTRPELTKDEGQAFECYGDAIDMALNTIEGVEPAVLRIPTKIRPSLMPPTTDEDKPHYWRQLWQRQCHEEPVRVASLSYVMGNTPNSVFGLRDTLLIHRIRFSGLPHCETNQNLDSLRGYCDPNLRDKPLRDLRNRSQFKTTEDGYLHIGPYDDIGFFLWPGGYVFPNGDEFALGCSPQVGDGAECSVSYQLARGVSMKYWFDSKKVPRSRWIELDRTIRDAAYTLIIDPQPIMVETD